jgi:hypothetical protein
MPEEKENNPAQITRRASNLISENLVVCFIKNNLKINKMFVELISQHKTTPGWNIKKNSLTTGSHSLMYCNKQE